MPPIHRCFAVAAVLLAATSAAAASSAAVPWWDGRVFYEIFVRSFADSTTGPLANDGTGDLPGLIERLDYLNDGNPATTTDLGITGLWLMPISPSPSYHGYDVTDYYGVNPEYGTREDLRRLLAECHKRGIRVIVDLVLNHSSSQHPVERPQTQRALKPAMAAKPVFLSTVPSPLRLIPDKVKQFTVNQFTIKGTSLDSVTGLILANLGTPFGVYRQKSYREPVTQSPQPWTFQSILLLVRTISRRP